MKSRIKQTLQLPLLLLKARRPSRIKDMPLVHDMCWLRQGYDAMTFFGTIVTANEKVAREMEQKASSLKRHEMIHLRQAQHTHDSWCCFYLLYIWYYLRAIPMNRKLKNAAYVLNPFEMEAYAYMNDQDYLNNPCCGKEWRRFAKMTPAQRLSFYQSTPPSSPGITSTSR